MENFIFFGNLLGAYGVYQKIKKILHSNFMDLCKKEIVKGRILL